MTKSYNDNSNALIADTKLLQLNLHILTLEYLEEEASHFIELSIKDKSEEENEYNLQLQVFDSKEEKNK